MKKFTLGLSISLALGVTASAIAEERLIGDPQAQQTTESVQENQPIDADPGQAAEPKTVRIGVGRDHSRGGLELSVSGYRSRYQVGEPIEFYIHGNRTFFLWAYTRDDYGRTILLVPSAVQRGNKYPGGQRHRLPNPNTQFYADSPGLQEIVLVASTKWLEFDNWLNRNARTEGDYWTMDTAAFEAALEKGVRIGRPPRRGDDRPSPGPGPSHGLAVRRVRFRGSSIAMATKILPISLTAMLALMLASIAQAVDIGDLAEQYRADAQSKGISFDVPNIEADVQRLAESGVLDELIAERKDMGDPRLGLRLKHLIAGLQVKGGDSLSDMLDILGAPDADDDTVELVVMPDNPGQVSELIELAQQHSSNALALDDLSTVFVTLPRDRLESYIDQTPVHYLDLSTRMEPYLGNAVGEGGALMHVEHLHRAGVTGKGVTTAIFDLGFSKYQQLIQDGELPQPLGTKSFGKRSFGEGSVHGTACAEIVADIAPGARQLLLQFDGSPSSLLQALKWLYEQDIDIVNASWGTHLSRIDGLSETDRLVDQFITKRNVLWVNAAGNEAQRTWTGSGTDNDSDGWIDIAFADKPQQAFLAIQAKHPLYGAYPMG